MNSQFKIMLFASVLLPSSHFVESKAFAFGGAATWFADQPQNRDTEITPQARQESAARNEKFSAQSAEAQRQQQWEEILKTRYAELPTDEPGAMNSLHMLRDVEHLKQVFSRDMSPYAPEGYVKHTHSKSTVAQAQLRIVSSEHKSQMY